MMRDSVVGGRSAGDIGVGDLLSPATEGELRAGEGVCRRVDI